MPTTAKNKRIIIGLIAVFLVLGAVFILDTPGAKAGFLDAITHPGQFVASCLAWLAYIILAVFSKFISLAAFLLEAVFELEDTSTFTQIGIVTRGWEVTRGVCNMFFALILLLMSFDTILQTHKFPIKTILPKLILVALTINFSLVFLGIFLDFSQIMTRFFIDAAGGPSGSIATQLANSLNIHKVFQTPTNLDSAENIQAALGGATPSLITIFGTLIFGIVIILIAAFAIAAGAVFMLIRLVSLWVLLIFAPFAWLSMIVSLPGLSDLTAGWWKKFWQWTFFAPIYAFFIYLAVMIAGAPIFHSVETAAQKEVSSQTFMSGFLSPENGIALLLQYIVVIIILVYGLKTSQTLGIKYADAVIDRGKKWRGKITSYARRPLDLAYDKTVPQAVGAAGSAVGIMPGFKRFGRRLEAKGTQMKLKSAERDRQKAQASLFKNMSDKGVTDEISSAFGPDKLLAAREAKERGLLGRTEDLETVKKAMAVFGAYDVKDAKGKTKEQKDLENIRFDAVDNDKDGKDTYRKSVIRRSKESGDLDKIQPIVMQNEAALNSLFEELSGPEFEEQIKKWGKKTKQTFEQELLKVIRDSADFGKDDIIKKQEIYAATTGKVNEAFGSPMDKAGKINVSMDDPQMKALASHIGKMTAASIAKMKHEGSEADISLVAKLASSNLITSFGLEKSASSKQKEVFYETAYDRAVKDKDEKTQKALLSPGWAAFSKEKKSENKDSDNKKNNKNPAGFVNTNS